MSFRLNIAVYLRLCLCMCNMVYGWGKGLRGGSKPFRQCLYRGREEPAVSCVSAACFAWRKCISGRCPKAKPPPPLTPYILSCLSSSLCLCTENRGASKVDINVELFQRKGNILTVCWCKSCKFCCWFTLTLMEFNCNKEFLKKCSGPMIIINCSLNFSCLDRGNVLH